MSEGTGSGFLDDVLDIGLNIFTAGTVGFDEEGIGRGVVSEFAVDTVKEVTGAAAAEEANEQARKQFELEKERLEKQRQDALQQDAQRQIQASRAASSARSTSNKRSTGGTGGTGGTSSLLSGDIEGDFLGL